MNDRTERGVIVVTMAGASQRFKAVGLHVPKWTLMLGDLSMLERSVQGLLPLTGAYPRLRFVGLGSKPHLVDRAAQTLNIQPEYVQLDHPTRGQAETAYLGTRDIAPTVPVVVWNVDTILQIKALEDAPRSGNWLSLMRAPGDHWSFAKFGDDGLVSETAEKRRISDWASIGLYAFESLATFDNAFQRGSHPDDKEQYVAPLYNHVVAAGRLVRNHLVPASAVDVVGTPAELGHVCRARGWHNPLER